MRFVRGALAALLIFVAAFVVYCLAVVAEGYVQAPKVAAAHAAKDPITLHVEDLTPEQLKILLSVEDPKFYEHHGVDLRTHGAGMTTITQGLVKFLYFDRFKPGIAKLRQSLLAIGFDARIEKDAQLAIFLSSGYLGEADGRSVLGFDDAATTYFGRPFGELTREQYVAIVAMCVGPNRYRPGSPELAGRVQRIERMLRGECHATRWLDIEYEACGK